MSAGEGRTSTGTSTDVRRGRVVLLGSHAECFVEGFASHSSTVRRFPVIVAAVFQAVVGSGLLLVGTHLPAFKRTCRVLEGMEEELLPQCKLSLVVVSF